MLTVRLPKDVTDRLEKLASKTGRTKTYYVKEAVMTHLEDLEDIYLSLERLEHPGKTWSLEELENEVDMED